MPVTITAGITFSGGGLTMAFAPPTEGTAGWWAGGGSTVQRITFATDTDTPTIRGPLSRTQDSDSATGTLDYGWHGGGLPIQSTIDRITYATDTNTASVRGPLNRVVQSSAASTDGTTYGWFGGGYGGVPLVLLSAVSRITFATDTATATGRGSLTYSSKTMVATGTDTYGWFGGGFAPGPERTLSIINRITYATDTATATYRGLLPHPIRALAAVTDSTTYGWFGGGYLGYVGTFVSSIVNRMTFANDTAALSGRGPLTIARQSLSSAFDKTKGWFGGGYVNGGGGSRSTVDRITYATDTDSASTRGPLLEAISGTSSTSGVQ